MDLLIYISLSVLIVSLVSLVGVYILSLKIDRLHPLLVFFVAFAAGALLGDVFFHLIPESIKTGYDFRSSIYILTGIILSFVIEKIIQWRHCHILPGRHAHVHPFAWMNLYGDGVHNFIDGLVIGASYLVSIPAGLATTLAVVSHEIPQEIGDAAVLLQGGFKKSKVFLLNFLTALTALAGGLTVWLIGNEIEGLTLFFIPFAAGNFLYIASTDLVPELHKDVRIGYSIFQLAALILGLVIMYLLTFIG